MAYDTDASMQSAILDIVGSFSCMPEFSEMKGFFGNINNMQAARDAYSIYGLPPKNRNAVHHLFGGWTDYCDWDLGMYKFYIMTQLLSNYPIPTTDKTNCKLISGYVDALESEKKNAAAKYTITNDSNRAAQALDAINTLQSKFNGMFNSMDCTTYLNNQAAAAAQAAQDAARQASITDLLNATNNIGTSSASSTATADTQTGTAGALSTSNIQTYALLGGGILFAVIIVAKLFNRN